jgi:hypothetical protein
MKKKIYLSIITIFSIQFVQLAFVPGSGATRPVTPFLILLVVTYSFAVWLNKNHFNVKIKSATLTRWMPFLSIVFFHNFIFWVLSDKKFIDLIMFDLSILMATLYYFMGFTQLGMGRIIFIKTMIRSYEPLLLLGLLEAAGLLFLPQLSAIVNDFRDYFLSYNLDKTRLHLLFSEPSFLCTYILLFFYLLETQLKINKTYISCISLILFLSGSLSVLAMFMMYFLIKYYQKNKIIFITLTFFIFIGISISIGDRLFHLSEDLSGYIRLTNIFAMFEMGNNNYYLGSGIGGYSEYFYSFLQGTDLRGSSELNSILSGDNEAVPMSMVGQIYAYMGLPGLSTFVFMIFYGNSIETFKGYKLVLFLCMISALPWGMPYPWILLGLIDSQIHMDSYERSKTN